MTRRTLAALLAVLLCTPGWAAEEGYRLEPASRRTKLVWGTALVVGATLDEYTTHGAFSRGGGEASPIPRMVGPTGRKILKVGVGLGVIELAKWFHRTDRKKVAHGLVAGLAAAFVVAAIHNHRGNR